VRRQTPGRQPETVALLTSASPQRLDAPRWLQLNRAGFGGIENGLHQRLDVSLDDDRCRVRHPNGMAVMGLFRRFNDVGVTVVVATHDLHLVRESGLREIVLDDGRIETHG